MKFIHTSDWQIGMPFHFLKEKSRNLMEEARLEAVEKISEFANKRENQIDFILICGDLVDSPRIAETTLKKMFRVISKIDRPVYILAGNHEWEGTEFLFENSFFKSNLPPNVMILEKGLTSFSDNVEIVAAPLEGKHADRDVLSEVLNGLEPSEKIRVVAGHGTLSSFIGVRTDVKPLDFSVIQKSFAEGKIDYVALGDRHSTTRVDEQGKLGEFRNIQAGEQQAIYYSGAHEVTDYNELDPGNILVVQIDDSKKVSVVREHVGTWSFLNKGTSVNSPLKLRTRQDINDLEMWINSLDKPSRTAVKVYIDSVLLVEEETRRRELFREWEEHALGGFKMSENEGLTLPRIKEDPLEVKVPENINGYVKSAYEELRLMATSGSVDSETALEALTLLNSWVGQR